MKMIMMMSSIFSQSDTDEVCGGSDSLQLRLSV